MRLFLTPRLRMNPMTQLPVLHADPAEMEVPENVSISQLWHSCRLIDNQEEGCMP